MVHPGSLYRKTLCWPGSRMTEHSTVLPEVTQQRVGHLCVTIRAGVHGYSVYRMLRSRTRFTDVPITKIFPQIGPGVYFGPFVSS